MLNNCLMACADALNEYVVATAVDVDAGIAVDVDAAIVDFFFWNTGDYFLPQQIVILPKKIGLSTIRMLEMLVRGSLRWLIAD